MIIQLRDTDLELVLDFKLWKLSESGCCRPPAGWRPRSLERYQNLYKAGKCLHLGYQAGNRVVALAGAWFCDDAPFLSTQPVRHGLLIDEYVLPEHRNAGIAGRLRDHLLSRLVEKGVCLTTTLPPNTARLACAAGNLRW